MGMTAPKAEEMLSVADSEGEIWDPLPHSFHSVGVEDFVPADESCAVLQCFRDEQAIEGIAVVVGQPGGAFKRGPAQRKKFEAK